MRTRQAVGSCDEWPGARTENGYGAQWVNGKVEYAHRVAYAEVHGPIPVGMEIDHLCENKPCRRVDHLEVVTHAENGRRSAKYDERMVDLVRHLSRTGLSTRKVAAATGVSKSHVHSIVSGRCWA